MKTLIIGGGLSGLALAHALETKRHDYLLLEARDRFGGRIKTVHYGAGYFDMGPAWFWPGQPRIAALIDRLVLEKFDQYSSGILTHEDETGQVHRGRGFSGMQGSWRLNGGLAALTQRLADDLPEARKFLAAPVKALIKKSHGITAVLADGRRFEAQKVVLAMPPRIAAQISFEPTLPDGAMQSMQGIATWMAGQAKVVAVYETPFWREAGLSGDATSRIGPMVEIHDASPSAGGPYALFGFIGIPPQGRRDEATLRQDLIAQLARLFGPRAQAPAQMFVEDWAFDPFAATTADHAPLSTHPTYGLPPAMTGLWDGDLRFAGTEVATQFGGYLEGALEAAEDVL
tara:strand:+ start:505 stop:1536 length:1032 start_codon:yes stop_codon:yes gene_type:complete